MDSSCFYAAVTGQPLSSAKEYYKLICNMEAPIALLQLSLFTSKPSKRSNTAAQQQEQKLQQQAQAPSKISRTAAASQPRQLSDQSNAAICHKSTEAAPTVSIQTATATALQHPAAAGGHYTPPEQSPKVAARQQGDTSCPVSTSSLLGFSIWDCQHLERQNAPGPAAAVHAAGLPPCSQGTASAPYRESLWLEDLCAMQAEALQHL